MNIWNETNICNQTRKFTIFSFFYDLDHWINHNSFHVENFFFTTLLPDFYPVNLQQFSCKHFFSVRVENSVNPNQISSEAS